MKTIDDMSDTQYAHYIARTTPTTDIALGVIQRTLHSGAKIKEDRAYGQDQVIVFGSMGWIRVIPVGCRSGKCRVCAQYGHYDNWPAKNYQK